MKMKKSATIIETERIKLRTWTLEDCEAYYNINRESRVIEFVKGCLTMDQVQKFIEDNNTEQEKRGYALWAAEFKETGELMGFIGLSYCDWKASFTPAVKIGWRLGSNFWGKGYATEGARAALEYGFMKVGLDEIVAFTVPDNKRIFEYGYVSLIYFRHENPCMADE
jgi:RimJ/RimL family protein N-acetyltransferase